MIKRIAITGPESSGKTTLAEDLANHYQTHFAPEYSRKFLAKNKNYTQADLDSIAQGQLNEIKNIQHNQLVIADTEMLVMKIWSLVVFKSVSDFIEKAFQAQQFDLYILCSPDIPWQFDELRVDENNRDYLFELYHFELKKNNLPFIIVSGTKQERIEKVLQAITEIK